MLQVLAHADLEAFGRSSEARTGERNKRVFDSSARNSFKDFF